MKVTSIILTILLILITSCGPIHDMQYHYIPPKKESAKPCIIQCEYMKNNCNKHCHSQRQTCRYQKRLQENNNMLAIDRCNYNREMCYQTCQSNHLCRNSCDFSWHDCRRYTSANNNIYLNDCNSEECEKSCTSTYNSCFTSCGGEVKEERVCVAFCNKKQ